MNGGLRRSGADLACRLLLASLPRSLQSWGWAIRHETASIPDDTRALLFALGGLFGLLLRAFASHLFYPFASLTGAGAFHAGGSHTMNAFNIVTARPRALGIACAIGAVALGLAYMMIAGAPNRYLAINAGALTVGLATLSMLGRAPIAGDKITGAAMVAMSAALLATALLGNTADGAARWVNLGGFSVQPSLVLLPIMLVAFARTRDLLATAGIIIAVIAMALQPDRAMAAMLVLGLAALAMMRPDRHVLAALAFSVAGFAVTLFRADTLPASLYVDQIFYSSFDVHIAAGMAVLAGSTLLLIPAIIGWRYDPAHRATYAGFGAVWLAAIMAAALGNYPTPMVGYGGSAIIGYALSLLALPRLTEARSDAAFLTADEKNASPTDHHLLTSMA